MILSVGWAHEGYSARDIDLDHIGVGWILAEGGLPRRFKAAYLTDDEIELILDILRRRHTANRHHNNKFPTADTFSGCSWSTTAMPKTLGKELSWTRF